MRYVRVAQLLAADSETVQAATRSLPTAISAVSTEVPSGTLLTLELRRPWHDLRPRSRVLRRLHATIDDIETRTHRTRIVAAAIRDGDRILAAQRSQPESMRGKWEFPGGKVEPGESLRTALVRECLEELGTDVVVGPELGRVELDSDAVLVLFDVRLAPGAPQPSPLEHLALGWFDRQEREALDWLSTNRTFVTVVTGL